MIEKLKFLLSRASLPIKVLLGFALLALVSLLLSKCSAEPPGTPQVFSAAPALPQAEKVAKVSVPVKKLVVYDKAALAKKVDLPAPIAQDRNAQVTSTAKLPASKGGYEVLSFTNVSTGASSIVSRPLPRPLIGFEPYVELGMRYGLSSDAGQTADIFGRYTFLRVGGAHLALYGELSSAVHSKAMAEISYRW